MNLKKVNIWLNANKLTINVKQTHYMMIHRTRIKHGHTITMYINKNPIERKTSTKFLGIIINNTRNWSAHITYIKNKISKSIGIISKIKNFEKYVLLFHLPIFFFGLKPGEMPMTHIKIQKRGIRTITFTHYLEHSAPLFNKLNILHFKRFVKQIIYLFMFKHHINILPSPLI